MILADTPVNTTSQWLALPPLIFLLTPVKDKQHSDMNNPNCRVIMTKTFQGT
jgi:hypothetical protein